MENGYGWILTQANLLVMDNDMKKSIYNHFVRWKDFYYGVNLMRGNGIFLTKKQYSYYKESTDNVSIIGNKKITKALTDSGVESRTNEFDTCLPLRQCVVKK